MPVGQYSGVAGRWGNRKRKQISTVFNLSHYLRRLPLLFWATFCLPIWVFALLTMPGSQSYQRVCVCVMVCVCECVWVFCALRAWLNSHFEFMRKVAMFFGFFLHIFIECVHESKWMWITLWIWVLLVANGVKNAHNQRHKHKIDLTNQEGANMRRD